VNPYRFPQTFEWVSLPEISKKKDLTDFGNLSGFILTEEEIASWLESFFP
jgi:hypothetical protein